jgi:hypothetical protein
MKDGAAYPYLVTKKEMDLSFPNIYICWERESMSTNENTQGKGLLGRDTRQYRRVYNI